MLSWRIGCGCSASTSRPRPAAKNSSHHRSPDHDYYAQVKNRHGGKIAAIAVARKLTRRCYHILREIDPDQVYVVPD